MGNNTNHDCLLEVSILTPIPIISTLTILHERRPQLWRISVRDPAEAQQDMWPMDIHPQERRVTQSHPQASKSRQHSTRSRGYHTTGESTHANTLYTVAVLPPKMAVSSSNKIGKIEWQLIYFDMPSQFTLFNKSSFCYTALDGALSTVTVNNITIKMRQERRHGTGEHYLSMAEMFRHEYLWNSSPLQGSLVAKKT